MDPSTEGDQDIHILFKVGRVSFNVPLTRVQNTQLNHVDKWNNLKLEKYSRIN